MTLVFQIIAIAAVLVIAVVLFRGGGARQQAARTVFMILFILLAASAVIFPNAWTSVAHVLGIGRGADLLLYLTVLVVLGLIVTALRRFRRIEQDQTVLARRIALDSARAPE